MSLQVYCDNAVNGCSWIGELKSLEGHSTSCDFALLPCPNKCKESDWILRVLRKEMETHKKSKCPRRQYECHHCRETGEYQERTTTHIEECPQLVIPCPNDRCGKEMPRCEIRKHRDTACMFEVIECKYHNSLGCTIKLIRQDISEHENDPQSHFPAAMKMILGLQKQNESIQKRQAVMEKLINQPKKEPSIKLTNFGRYKSSNDSVYLPPFYTSPGGYKICIRVVANGSGDGKGTHLSVFAHIMHGENDGHLPWPFSGTVTVMLLNQLEDKCHHSGGIDFRPHENGSQRVEEGERSQWSCGIHCFIAHTSLEYNASKNCRYLLNDCLYFRIKSEGSKLNQKPWLVTPHIL